MLAVDLAAGLAVLARVLAALERAADGRVDAVRRRAANAVRTVDGRLNRVAHCILRATSTRRRDVVDGVEGLASGVARRAEEAADGAVEAAEQAAALAGHVLAAGLAALAVHLARVLAVDLAAGLAGVLAVGLAVGLAGRLAGVLAVGHLFLQNTTIFFMHVRVNGMPSQYERRSRGFR